MLHNVTSTSHKNLRSKLAPSREERKELGLTSSMCMRIFNNLHEVNERHNAEWLAQNS